jgi:hypothetical protein
MISRSEILWAGGFLVFCCAAAGLRAGTIPSGPGKVPEDFPSDFPVYKNAVVKKYAPIVPANPKLGNVLTLETPDAKGEALDFYREQLPAKGWTVEKPLSNAPDSLTACKGERRISVSVLDSQTGTKHTTLIQLGVNGTP